MKIREVPFYCFLFFHPPLRSLFYLIAHVVLEFDTNKMMKAMLFCIFLSDEEEDFEILGLFRPLFLKQMARFRQ